MDDHEPPSEGIYLMLRVPYVGVAFWSPERHRWYQVDAFQEPLDPGYVIYWALLPTTGTELTRLITAGLWLPELPPWYGHMALAMGTDQEDRRLSSVYGVPTDAVTDPRRHGGPYVGAAYRRVIIETLRAGLRDTTFADKDLSSAVFALAAAIQWQAAPPSVARSALLDAALFDAVVSFLFGGGPSWIHANLSLRPAGVPVIDITTGQAVGNPRPAINISWKAQDIRITEG